MNQQHQLDIVSVVILVATMLFSPEVASVVGPYLVIVFASTIGASFALARREKTTRWGAFGYFLRVNGVAVFLTAGMAAGVSAYWPAVHERSLFAPIAFLLGLAGEDWPAIARWGFGKVNALIDLAIKLRGGGQ